jgi:hypothetical protein
MSMNANLERTPEAAVPAQGRLPLPGKRMMAWWADEMAEASRLAAALFFFPPMATLRNFRRIFADVAALGGAVVAEQQRYWEGFHTFLGREAPPYPGPAAPPPPSGVPGMTGPDLEELREAWHEFEVNRGDWSKSR